MNEDLELFKADYISFLEHLKDSVIEHHRKGQFKFMKKAAENNSNAETKRIEYSINKIQNKKARKSYRLITSDFCGSLSAYTGPLVKAGFKRAKTCYMKQYSNGWARVDLFTITVYGQTSGYDYKFHYKSGTYNEAAEMFESCELI